MIKNVKRIKRYNDNFTLLKKKLKELGTTFCAKLFIKLTSKIFIPDLYLQILKYEYNNRTNDDIAKTLPRFQSLESLNDYIKYQEDKTKNNNSKIILELAWVSFYKYKKKLSFVKKANEDKSNFYLILNGNLSKFNLTFKKEKISIEEYLLYMIKMKLLQEKQILYKCNKLNSAYIHLDINNFKTFFSQNKDYNFKELKQRAKKDLLEAGFTFSPYNNKVAIPSMENYLKLSFFRTVERNDTQTRFNLFIGSYIKVNTLSKGNYIGDLSKNENNEGCTYICDTKCDICYVNKSDSVKSKLYELILEKYKKIFKKVKNKYYIFKDTSDRICLNNFVPLMIYKKYKKGEKIIIQNSQYEGIYLIIDGEVKISISQTFNELSNTLVSLQYSIFNFKDYVSKIIKTIDIIREFNLKYMIKEQNRNMIDMGKANPENDILSSNEYLSYFNGIKNIEFYTLKEGDIVGLNELFDYKTELYNFTAECVSDETNLFFISKRNFNDIIEKENNIMNNVIQLIDLKAKTLIGKINNYRHDYRNVVINKLNNKKHKNTFLDNTFFGEKKNKNFLKKEICKINDNKIKLSKTKDFIISMGKKNKRKKSSQNTIKLFKNNELLNYLKNRALVRNNSNADSLIFFNKNKHLLTNRYIYHPKFNMTRANSTTNNFRTKIKFKDEIFTPPKSKTKYENFYNANNFKSQSLIKNNTFNINLKDGKSSKIIFNNSIMHLNSGEAILSDIINNQKKFDAYVNESLYTKDLPALNEEPKKTENITKKIRKNESYLKLPYKSNFSK